PTFTLSPPPTDTNTPTPEVSATPTPQPIIPTATPIPPGTLPFVADMEGDNPIKDWEYLPEQWQVRTDGGNTALYGTTGFDSSLTVLGRQVPEWVQPGQDDLLISFRVNLLEGNSLGRFIFKFQPNSGYYVLEVLSGRAILKRGPAGVAPSRPNELPLATFNNAPIQNNRWYEFSIWAEGSRVFVYLNKQLVMSATDRELPLLPGSILLQTASSQANPVGWDDLIVQRPELASEHFEGSSFPNTWERSSQQNVSLQSDGTNQFIQLDNAAEVRPVTPPMSNFILYARLNNTSLGFEMFVRESNQGSLEFDWDAGNVVITQYSGTGEVVWNETLGNFYGRARFEEFVITIVGERLTIFDSGEILFEEDLPGLSPSGFSVLKPKKAMACGLMTSWWHKPSLAARQTPPGPLKF
ncbi:MAG: hypothetical protein HC915_11145, partial [Anaerolineae bacterium]|nr:hypothetical protein [Anaerolineae bacterium]